MDASVWLYLRAMVRNRVRRHSHLWMEVEHVRVENGVIFATGLNGAPVLAFEDPDLLETIERAERSHGGNGRCSA